MKRKNLFVIYLIIMATLSFYIIHSRTDKPEYLEKAAEQVSSYLSNEYGSGMACESTKISEHLWQLNCFNASKSKLFEFKVFQEENAPTEDSESFYLETMNDNAKQSAHQGLMQYLKINTP